MSVTNNTAEPRLELDCQGNLECAICLQIFVHPAKLPCGHIFCFLCIKGVAFQSRRCAMCRQDIPADYLDKPDLIQLDVNITEENKQTDYQWYYEGRNGWWRYDNRSNLEIETAWQNSKTNVDLLLAGALYNIDFQNMIQHQSRHPSRKRKIKRDSFDVPAKGTAGLRSGVSGQSSSTTPTVSNANTINVSDVTDQMRSLSMNDSNTNTQPEVENS